MQLKVVLLPDPFGPISPRISPSSTANETSWTARNAPNRFESPDTLSIGMQDSRLGLSLPAARGGIRTSPRVGVALRQRQHGVDRLDARRPGDFRFAVDVL